MEEEIWKDIEGYEGLYQVSNLGRVKSLKFWHNKNKRYYDKEKIRKLSEDKDGYLIVTLCHNKKRQIKRVHRLVAEAFISNPDNKLEINHINGVKKDNRIKNLEWCTRSENEIHSYRVLKREPTKYWKGKKKGLHPFSKEVIQYEIVLKEVARYANATEAQEKLNKKGITRESIRDCCRNKRRTAGGYVWRYIEDEQQNFVWWNK